MGVFVGLGFELIETVQYGAAGALEDANSDVDGLLIMWFTCSSPRSPAWASAWRSSIPG